MVRYRNLKHEFKGFALNEIRHNIFIEAGGGDESAWRQI